MTINNESDKINQNNIDQNFFQHDLALDFTETIYYFFRTIFSEIESFLKSAITFDTNNLTLC